MGGNNGKGNGGQTKTEATTAASPSSSTSATTTEATTTMEVTTTPDMTDPDTDVEERFSSTDVVDDTDITLFKVGVYMRMAHPQGGALAPIHSVPFCDPTGDCLATPLELEAGTIAIDTADFVDGEE